MGEPTKCYWKIIKFPCEMSIVAIMNRSLYYSKIIFRVIQTMAKIVNNEFQVNVMNKIEAFGYVLKRRQTFFTRVTISSNVLNPHKLLDHVTSVSSVRFKLMISYYYITYCYFKFGCSIK